MIVTMVYMKNDIDDSNAGGGGGGDELFFTAIFLAIIIQLFCFSEGENNIFPC